jgi:hypothetical protein
MLLAGGLLLVWTLPAIAAPTWSPPTPLSGAGNAVALEPSIAINDGGLGIEAWAETIAGTSVIRAAQHVAGGAWTPFAGNLSTAFPGDGCSPFAAIDPAGNALVVWSQWAGPGCGVGNRTILFATRAAGAAAWSTPGVVGPATPAGDWVTVAASSSTGQMIVAWSTTDTTKKIYAAIGSTTGGFGAPAKLVDVPTADNLYYLTAAIGPSGDAAVQWVHIHGMNSNIEASVRRPGGAFPATATPLTNLTSPSTSTLGSLAINAEGDILSGFQKYDGTNVSFVSEIYPMNGTAWILPQTITTVITPYTASWLSVGIDSHGNSTVVWVESDFTTTSPYVRRLWSAIRPSGVASTWIGQTPLSDPTRSNDNTTTLAVAPSGAAAASWGAATPLNSVQAVYRPAGGSFGALTQVSAGAGSSTSGSGASISMAPTGDAAISFVGPGPPTDARVSVFDTTAPGISPVAVPASATTGQAVAMSAGASDAWSALASGQPSWNFGDGNLGAGGAVSHVYPSPGTYTVTIGASDALGNAATPVTRQIVVSNAGGPPPPGGKPLTTVKKPKLKAAWKAGHLVGTISVSGTVGVDTTLTTSIRRHGSKKTRATSKFKVKKGKWSHTLKLPASLLPGRYDLFVTGPAVTGSKTSFTLAAPATGLVSRVYASGPRRGPAATTLGTSCELWAHFAFGSLPKKGKTITTQWILPNGSKLAANTRPRTSLVEAQVKDLSGKSLPTGRWRCVLTAGGVVVATLNVHLR